MFTTSRSNSDYGNNMASATKKPGLSLDDLDARFNPNVIIPTKIKAGLVKLGDNAMSSVDFAKLCDIGILQLTQFGDQFPEYQIPIKENGKLKLHWGGTEAFVRKARERLGV